MTNHVERFREVVARHPTHTAILRGSEATSFAELEQLSRSYGAWLLEQGLQRHDRVLLWLSPGPEMAAALLGTWMAGGIAVLVDPATHPEAYLHVLQTSEPRFVLHQPDQSPPSAVGLEHDVTALPTDLALHRPANLLPTEPASILFTSGSTGMPKGVVQSHGNLLRGARAVSGYLGLTPEDRLLCPVPWSFDYGFVNLQMTLSRGAVHVLPATPDLFRLAADIEQQRPTLFAGVPGVFPYVASSLKSVDTSALRAVTNTGGTVPANVLQGLFDALPEARFFLNYGLTESFRTACLDPLLARDKPLSIGRGIPGVEVVVLDEEGRPAKPGEEGEIVHRGDYVFLGYWNDPESTLARRRPDPLAPAGCPHPPAALYTGDQGVIDNEGLLYFKGRRDRQLKSMGRRVSPTEVEALIHHSGLVSEVAVFGVPHPMLGHEICATVVPNPGVADAVPELKKYAKGLPAHLVPRRWTLCDSLPRTHTGKVDYKAVEALASSGKG